MDIINFHTHTVRCNHAVGSVRDYLLAARETGVSALGMADHAPEPSDSYTTSRMTFAELPGYIREVRECAAEFPDLRVYLGMEVERFPSFTLADIRKIYTADNHFDYLIGAVHPAVWHWEDPDSPDGILAIVRRMVKENIEMIQSGLFICMAHPDIFGHIADCWQDEYDKLAKELITAANDCKVFLEFNAYGLRKPMKSTSAGMRYQYPLMRFWEIASKMGVHAVIGMDSHAPEDVSSNWMQAYSMLRDIGIEPENQRMEKIIQHQQENLI